MNLQACTHHGVVGIKLCVSEETAVLTCSSSPVADGHTIQPDPQLVCSICAVHGCTAGILSARPHLDRRTIRVLNQSFWLKSLTAKQQFGEKRKCISTEQVAPLDELATSATVTQTVSLMDGRKAVGGGLELRLRQRSCGSVTTHEVAENSSTAHDRFHPI
ncbi:hypothetical protein CSKR_102135 [Clonorchis sinensis]|uniref:Uncharacterized protein n=1 Tax=Clonorchis sinensis TaxID=79923 RepID=A0A419QA38_CLOSI|nr:hypothetical protein CSKR_102135 [Clonorchis sinensis]